MDQDCYFYYYSTCSKGDHCQYRHCEAALGTEDVCDLWRKGKCTRKVCAFRHSDTSAGRQRSAIPCYWETHPGGCTKEHCPYQHKTQRPKSMYTDRIDAAKRKQQERFSTLKLKSLEDIKEERQASQVLTPSKGAAQWRGGGVPVSPTLVMPNTVFHPGMQPWVGKSQRQPFLQGNPYKFVAKPAVHDHSLPVAVEPSPKAVEASPKAVEPSSKAVESSPKTVKPATVAAAPKPESSKTSSSVETRQIEGKKSMDAKSEKSNTLQGSTEGKQRLPLKKLSSLSGAKKIGVTSSEMSGVKVKTLKEIRQERKRVCADTHEVGSSKKKITIETTAVQMDQATGQSHAQQHGLEKSAPCPKRSASMPPLPSRGAGVTVKLATTTTKPVGLQGEEDMDDSSSSARHSGDVPPERACTSPQSKPEEGCSVVAQVQRQTVRVKIRKPSLGPEAKPSLSPDVTAIENIKSAIRQDSGISAVVEDSLLDELEDETELSQSFSDTRDDDDVLLEIEEMINR